MLALLATGALAACSASVEVDPDAEPDEDTSGLDAGDGELRDVGDFDAVRLEAPLAVHLVAVSEVDEGAIVIDCEPEHLAAIQTRLDGETLVIFYDGDDLEAVRDCSLGISGEVDVEIVEQDEPGEVVIVEGDRRLSALHTGTLDLRTEGDSSLWIGDLEAESVTLRMEGPASLEVDRMVVDSLESRQEGQSSLLIHDLRARTWQARLGGSSSAVAAGRVDHLVVDARGDAALDTVDVIAESVEVDATGSSEVAVTATQSADVTASGDARVDVSGDPAETSVDVSGSAEVNGI